ncbi:hypothetical protein YPPY99_4839, partial [Yersinia pestis PY-99]
MPSLLLRSC